MGCEKKSRFTVVGPTARPTEPLVRNTKRRGEIVEIAFLHTVANMGFAVTKPYGDSEPCDFIVDLGNRLWRVQVKSCLYRNGLTFQVGARHRSLYQHKGHPQRSKSIFSRSTLFLWKRGTSSR